MLVVFRVGRGEYSDVIDVIPREKEAVIRQRGLGKKAGQFYWVEVDDAKLSNEAFLDLANEMVKPDIEIISQADDSKPQFKPKQPKQKLVNKRRYQLKQKDLDPLDSNFNGFLAERTSVASRIYPKQKITLDELRKLVKDKRTGRDLNGE